MRSTTPPLPAPVRATRPPAPPAPRAPRRPRSRPRPPRGSLAATGFLAAAALAGFAYLGYAMYPAPGPSPLRAPVAQALGGACVFHPAICRASVRIPSAP